MGDNRTPDNKNSDDIKGGGNPFVDYDFYLRSQSGPSANRSSGHSNTAHDPDSSHRPDNSAAHGPNHRPARNPAHPNNNKQPAPNGVRPRKTDAEPVRLHTSPKPWYIRLKERIARFYSTKRPLKVTMTVIIALILIAVIVVLSFAYGFLGKINTDGDDDVSRNAVFENESNFAMMTDPNSQGFRAMLKEWAGTGEKMHSKNVVNILLIGLDGDGTRTDSMILASVNKKTKAVNLISIYRDCFTYAAINGEDRYMKLNEVSSRSSIDNTIETIENNFKIEIDDYVAVDFTSFPEVIDAVGGVTIDITDAEYRWLLNHEGVNVGGSGPRKLNGQEALAYCRIRYLDSDGDVSRTERQRKVIMSLMESGKSASIGQVTDMLNVLLPMVTTSMSRTGILSLATQAVSGQWYNYKINSDDAPVEEAREGADGVATSLAPSVWCWIVDYPLAAQQMQLALYGTTNIELSENRVTAIDLYFGRVSADGGSGSGSGGGSYDDLDNEDVPATTRSSSSGGSSETEPESRTAESTTRGETQPTTEKETETDAPTQTDPPQTTAGGDETPTD